MTPSTSYFMDKINSFLPLKPDSVGPPEMYLGAKLKWEIFDNDASALGLSTDKYVQQAGRNVETYLKNNLKGRFSLPKQGNNQFPCDCALKEDVTPLLEPPVATYFMQLIGVLGWMQELGSTSARRSPCCLPLL